MEIFSFRAWRKARESQVSLAIFPSFALGKGLEELESRCNLTYRFLLEELLQADLETNERVKVGLAVIAFFLAMPIERVRFSWLRWSRLEFSLLPTLSREEERQVLGALAPRLLTTLRADLIRLGALQEVSPAGRQLVERLVFTIARAILRAQDDLGRERSGLILVS